MTARLFIGIDGALGGCLGVVEIAGGGHRREIGRPLQTARVKKHRSKIDRRRRQGDEHSHAHRGDDGHAAPLIGKEAAAHQ